MSSVRKQYDQAYFDRWYRDPEYAVIDRTVLERRVHLAVSITEYLLERRVRRVLDVGCGEGVWRTILRRIRPRVKYVGLDPSTYVVRRYGGRRNIRLGGLGNLGELGLKGRFDLIVCSDVIHYVSTAELRSGLPPLAAMLTGVAYLEAFAREDEIEGDSEGFQDRSTATYLKLFRDAGLFPIGMHCYVTKEFATRLTAFEKVGR
jgi:SAM-dependent methyltransferase